MKTNATLFGIICTALVFAMTSARAQTYTNLHTFSSPGFNTSNDAETNFDGVDPYFDGVVASGNVLYGTTWEAGTNGNGTLYSVQTDGSSFTVVHTFSAPYVTELGSTNSDGARPQQGLALQSNVLYGTTSEGGPGGYGTVFKVNTDGTGFTNLHYFQLGTDGISPFGGVAVVGGTLYGTTTSGGTAGAGTVYRVNTDGSGYQTMHNFTGLGNDGGIGVGTLVETNGVLYGMTRGGGGTNGHGVIFALDTNANGTAAGYTGLHVFTGDPFPGDVTTNNDGASPETGLLLSDGTLYGTTPDGGTNGAGVVFSIQTGGTGFTLLHVFSYANPDGANTNKDGSDPYCTLTQAGNILYGTAAQGGANGYGTVFAVNTGGTGFTNLYTFTSLYTFTPSFMNIGGEDPGAGVILVDGNLYGTTEEGGFVTGNVYGIILPSSGTGPAPIPVSAQVSGGSIVLSWSGSAFSLYSTSSLNTPYTLVQGATSPYTVGTTNAQQFFRLQAN